MSNLWSAFMVAANYNPPTRDAQAIANGLSTNIP